MRKRKIALARAFFCTVLSAALILGALPAGQPQKRVAAAEGEEQVKVTALKSDITSMELGGYVGENVKGNVREWQIGAYDDNKGIIDKIGTAAEEKTGLDSVMGSDWFAVDDYYDIDVAETSDELSEKYAGVTLSYVPKKADAYRGDAGFKLNTELYPGITDWTGTEEVWVFVDATRYGDDVYLRFNFEEGEPDSAQWEAYSPVQGKESRLISADGTVTPVVYTYYDAYGDAFFKLDKGFKGFLAIPFNNDCFWRYANDGGNGVIDAENVRQATISVGGATAEAVGTPVYFAFAKVGAFEGGLDVPFGAAEGCRYENVLPVTVNAYVHDISDWAGAFCGELYNDWDVKFDYNIRGQSGNSLGWTLKKVPSSFGDRDLRFASDPEAVTDWSGAAELWVYVDARDAGATSLRVAFEENVVGRESFSLVEGSTVVLYANGNDAYRATTAVVEAGGYIPLPENFAGQVRMKLSGENFAKYWDEGGNNALDLGKVVQFQLALKAGDRAVGNTVYLDDFAIVGDVNGEELDGHMYFGSNSADKDNPETAWKYVTPGYTYKKVWTLDGLAPRDGYTGNVTAWYGEFAGKLLTGMAYSYKATADAELKAAADKIVEDLAAAQGEDGYLGVFTGGGRFSIVDSNWDLWNHYHCITGLLEWYNITGNQTALEVATAALDCIYQTFHDRSYIVAGGYETNRAIMHGYLQAYRITRDRRYFDEALRILENDCNQPDGWYRCGLENRDFADSDCTRWEVLHMMMSLTALRYFRTFQFFKRNCFFFFLSVIDDFQMIVIKEYAVHERVDKFPATLQLPDVYLSEIAQCHFEFVLRKDGRFFLFFGYRFRKRLFLLFYLRQPCNQRIRCCAFLNCRHNVFDFSLFLF